MAVRNSVHLIGFIPKSEKFVINSKVNEEELSKSYYRGFLNVRRDFKNKEGQYDYDLMQITAFGGTAKYLATYAKHGDQLMIEGEVRRSDNYEKDGEVVHGQLYIHVNSAVIVSANPSENSGTGTQTSAPAAPKAPTGGSPLKKKLFGK